MFVNSIEILVESEQASHPFLWGGRRPWYCQSLGLESQCSVGLSSLRFRTAGWHFPAERGELVHLWWRLLATMVESDFQGWRWFGHHFITVWPFVTGIQRFRFGQTWRGIDVAWDPEVSIPQTYFCCLGERFRFCSSCSQTNHWKGFEVDRISHPVAENRWCQRLHGCY